MRPDLLKGPRTEAQRKVEDARDDVLAGHNMVLAALGLHFQQACKVGKLVASLTAKEEEEKKKEKESTPPLNLIGAAAGRGSSPPLRRVMQGQEGGHEARVPSLQQARCSPPLLVLPEEQPACSPDSPRFLPPPMLVPHPTANLDEQQPQLDKFEEEDEGEEAGEESEEEGDEREKDKKGDVMEKVGEEAEEEEWEEEKEEEEEGGQQLSPDEEATLRVQILNSLTRVVHRMMHAPTQVQLEAILAHFKRGKKLRGICTYFELATPLLRLLRKTTRAQNGGFLGKTRRCRLWKPRRWTGSRKCTSL